MQTDRRNWLKQSAFLLASLGVNSETFATTGNFSRPNEGKILLNSNENAYGPSPMARKAILEHYLQSNRYPDEMIEVLQKKIAVHTQVRPENVLLGAGSSEIIGLALSLSNRGTRHYLVAEPAYSVWQSQAQALGYQSTRVALNRERKYDLQKLAEQSKKSPPSFIYICNPNNPTGTFVDPDAIKKFVETVSSDHIVFIDEAYTEYAGLTSLGIYAIGKPNVIVARTFSKIYGLAGARIGYAIANTDAINKMAGLQPWPEANLSAASVAAATAALDDQDFVNDCKQKNIQAREICYDAFKRLELDYIPGSANFILFNIDKINGDLTGQMNARNIYVQHREHFGGRWCRVTMGTTDEMKMFVKALEEIKNAK